MTFPVDTADRPFALPRGGKRSRDKGMRGERAVVKILTDHGFDATKISAIYKPGPDVDVSILGRHLTCEVKCQATGWTRIYRWLEGAGFLVLKADRKEPLVVMRLREFAELAREKERAS